jgi:hypothetical protein
VFFTGFAGGKVSELTKMRRMTDRLFIQKLLQKSHKNPDHPKKNPEIVVTLDDGWLVSRVTNIQEKSTLLTYQRTLQ